MSLSEVEGVGLDLGSTAAKMVELRGGEVVQRGQARAIDWKEFVENAVGSGELFSTGYFRKKVEGAKAITEITAAKSGVAFLFPEKQIDVILDIGGQDTKVIETGSNRFILNDKCSAGTGAFLEFTARYFDIPLEELNDYHARAQEPVAINNTCGVFAISEMISYLVKGSTKEDVIAGMHIAWAKRIMHIIPEDFKTLAIIGGGARNKGVTGALEEMLDGVQVLIPDEPEFVNAVGAVVYHND